jgi:hypothetical protein
MATLAFKLDSTAIDVQADGGLLHVSLADGRKLTVPLAWSARLQHASPEQLKNWRLIGRGQGIHWPDLDEDISISSLMRLS